MDRNRLENLIFDELLPLSPKEKNFKRGFFAGSYLENLFRRPPGKSRLVTENDVRQFVASGAVVMSLPKGAILTPLARELLEEKNIKVEYGKT